jgi:hypothetical protein
VDEEEGGTAEGVEGGGRGMLRTEESRSVESKGSVGNRQQRGRFSSLIKGIFDGGHGRGCESDLAERIGDERDPRSEI